MDKEKAIKRLQEDIDDCNFFLKSSIKGKDREDLIYLRDALVFAVDYMRME